MTSRAGRAAAYQRSVGLSRILAAPAYQNNGVLFITWDEALTADGPIGMIVLSPLARGGGYFNEIRYTHSSTLRTLQEIFGVAPLHLDAAAAAAWLEALDGLPLLCLPVNTSADGSLLPTPGRILEHVLVPGDYSSRSGCVAACLQRIVRYGARVVTLLHVAHADRDRRCPPGGLGEMDEIDTEWVDHLKKTLFRAGVDEVRFIVPEAENSPALDELKPSVSLVVVGAACSGEITRTYCSAAERLFSSGKAVPALMFTAEACSVLGAIRGAA